MWLLIAQRLSLDFLWHLFYFPVWWYTAGVKKVAIYCFHVFQGGNIILAPALWLKNIFVPMFGQHDIQGRLISVFMRLMNVIFRSIALFFWFWVAMFIFTLWLVAPIFVVYMLGISF